MATRFRWSTTPKVAAYDLFAVRGDADGPIFVGGHGATLLRSDDLGRSWSPQPIKTGSTYALLGLCRGSNDAWHVVGGDGVVASSTDDGTTWKKQKSGTTIALTAVCSSREGVVVAVGGGVDPLLLRSEDEGKRWKRTSLKSRGRDFQGLYDVWGDADDLIAVATGIVLRSKDAGKTWKQSASPDEAMLVSVTGRGNERYACGLPNLLFRSTDRGERWTPVKVPCDSINRLWCSSSGELWACGNRGAVLRSDDGVKWTALKTGCKAELRSIWAEGDVVIAVGTKGTVLRGGR